MPTRPGSPAYWDRLHARSDVSESQIWRRHSDAVNLALLRRWVPGIDRLRVLKTDLFDEALADGLIPHWRGTKTTVVGIDLSPAVAAAAAARHAGLPALTADVRRLPFAHSLFDLVVSNSTLDHFPGRGDLIDALRELVRVLKPGGILVVTLDNPRNPMIWVRNGRLGSWLHRAGLVPYYPGYTCGVSELSGHLLSAGMRVLDRTAIMHCPRVLAVPLARMLEERTTGARAAFLRCLMAFEFLERFITRYWTGHFVGVLAMRPLPRTHGRGNAHEPDGSALTCTPPVDPAAITERPR